MAANQIKDVRIWHEQLLTWLILNPDKTQGEAAKHFMVTEAWLSTIINSDAFQARWRERRDFMAANADQDIYGRMREVASKALDRLTQQVETATDPEFLLSSADKMLNRLGFGAKSGGGNVNVQMNTYVASRDLIDGCRLRIQETGEEALKNMPLFQPRQIADPFKVLPDGTLDMVLQEGAEEFESIDVTDVPKVKL